jgi:hypothetical protein
VKVVRQNIDESYDITCDWIKDFAKSLTKNADFLDTLRSRFHGKETFSSVEDKMEDIKKRVGFDKIIKTNQSNQIVSEAGCAEENTGGEARPCDAGDEKSNNDRAELVAVIENVLRFIRDAAKDRPHRPASVILEECGESFDLDNMSIDRNKLHDYVKDHLKMNRVSDNNSVEYIPYEPGDEGGSDTADYYRHGERT